MRKILIIVSGTAALLSACNKIPSCEECRKRLFDKQADFVITDVGPAGFAASIEGLTTVTHQKVKYIDYDGLYHYTHVNSVIGDTLFKKQGQAGFTIKKRGFNVFIDYKCAGNEVVGCVIDTTYKNNARNLQSADFKH